MDEWLQIILNLCAHMPKFEQLRTMKHAYPAASALLNKITHKENYTKYPYTCNYLTNKLPLKTTQDHKFIFNCKGADLCSSESFGNASNMFLDDKVFRSAIIHIEDKESYQKNHKILYLVRGNISRKIENFCQPS